MNGGAPLGRTRCAPIFASAAAFASYPGMEAPNSSSVPRVKFIVSETNLILAGIRVSRSNSWPASGRLVGRTVPTRYCFCGPAITDPPLRRWFFRRAAGSCEIFHSYLFDVQLLRRFGHPIHDFVKTERRGVLWAEADRVE